MTDNLVERLREGFATNLEYEAADRIEELEAALREIADFELYCDNSNAYRIPPIARAALGEKKE